MQTITGLVAAGFGVSLVPISSQLLRSADVVYRPLQGATPTMDPAVAWLPEKLTPVAQNFCKWHAQQVHTSDSKRFKRFIAIQFLSTPAHKQLVYTPVLRGSCEKPPFLVNILLKKVAVKSTNGLMV